MPPMTGKHQARRTWWHRARDAATAFDNSPLSPMGVAALLRRARAGNNPLATDAFTVWNTDDRTFGAGRASYLDTLTAVLARASARGGLYALRNRAQRCVRGWSDTDVWNLDKHLCRTLADQLDYLSQHAVGYPGTPEYPTYDSWTAALRDNARKLRAGASSQEHDDAIEEWFTTEDPDAKKVAWDRMFEIEERNEALADEGLHWVAANRRHLWD